MKKQITTALVAVLLVLGMIASTNAQDASEDTTVTANVTSTVALDIKPEQLDYPSLEVGNLTTQSNRSFDGVDVANSGSEYLDRIWLGTTYPDDRPFGSGDPNDYDAANFMVAQPNNKSGLAVRGNHSVFHFINRRDYKDPSPPTFLQGKTTGTAEYDNYVRANFGDQWFWVDILTESSGSNAKCDGSTTNSELRVGQIAHTTDSLGTYDFSDDGGADGIRWENYSIDELSNTGYGVSGTEVEFNMSGSESNETYDILTACEGTSDFSETHIVLSKYNVQYNDSSDLQANTPGSGTTDILDTATDDNMLKPGESFELKLGMEVPRGVSAGQVSDGTLTVYATADKGAQVS